MVPPLLVMVPELEIVPPEFMVRATVAVLMVIPPPGLMVMVTPFGTVAE